MSSAEQPPSFRSFAFRSCLVGLLLVSTGPMASAGQLLRAGGGGGAASSATGGSVSAVTAAQAAALAQRSQAKLLRSDAVMQSLKAMQAAARTAAAQAASTAVPDGLAVGGLQVAPGATAGSALWQGAQLPSQTTGTDGRRDVTIVQTASQALLNWQTYNVGQKTTLTYDQSAGGANQSTWVAFNKINDPSGKPSQIRGMIKATGQVYIINQNGIIFGGTSQVNTHTLVASALPINDNLVARGLLNNPDFQFLFTALPQSAGANGPTDAFTPPAPLTADGRTGDIVVEAGAQLISPTNADKSGGRIALIGANVANGGSISTPDGQAILAAGLQVGFSAHAGDDPSLRGLDVFVGNTGDYAGAATNTGLIDAPRGSVLMTGKALNQAGAVTSTTSASLNGRIDLLASYDAVAAGVAPAAGFYAQTTGSVAFGAGSLTQILPELGSVERAVGTTLALPSQINVKALTIYLAPQALVWAPGANLALAAGTWSLINPTSTTADNRFVYTDGQIYVDQGASIDVSGTTDAAASVTDNIISVQLRGPELADSPSQRDGALRGQTIQIDIRQTGTTNGKAWVGTPLADTSGYVALVDHTVDQLTTNGGMVSLQAGGSVVMQAGATLDVSGGTTQYAGGKIGTTKVLSAGHIYDISQATADRVYTGIYTGNRSTYEGGYVQGGNAGAITITAPAMALDGVLQGNTVAGPRQRTVPPAPGGLNLVFQNQFIALDTTIYQQSLTPPAISFQSAMTLPAADAFAVDGSGHPSALRAERVAQVVLSPSLFSDGGFGNVSINNSEGDITVPVGSPLTLQPRGALTLQAANLTIADAITAPGGTLAFTATNISLDTLTAYKIAQTGNNPPPVSGRGRFTLGDGTVLSTAGLIVNDLASSSTAGLRPLATAGGSISINSYDAVFEAGSTLDVSGGVAVSPAGKFSYGAGGALSIKAGQEPVSLLLPVTVTGGSLSLDLARTALKGYSGGQGGALTVRAPLVQVGGTALLAGNTAANTLWINPVGADGGLLSNDFFSTGGFASFSLNGLGVAAAGVDQAVPAVRIAAGTTVAPVVSGQVASADPSATNGFSLTPVLQPVGIRPAANLVFNAVGVDGGNTPANSVRGDLVVSPGVRIVTDPKGGVSLTAAAGTVDVEGVVLAPGGSITVAGGGNSNLLYSVVPTSPLPTVVLGANSVLSAAGSTVLTPDTTGHDYRTGSVLSGGKISVAGNIVALAGAVADVSGTSGVLDLDPGYTSGATTSFASKLRVPTRINSAGGSISFAGGQELFLDAMLLGAGGAGVALTGERGGAPAAGGSLSVSSGFYVPSNQTPVTSPQDVTLFVTASGPVLPAYQAGQASVGQPVLSALGTVTPGLGYVAADTLNQGGFDKLSLGGTVQFKGPVALTADDSIRVADKGVIYADDAVTLSAPNIALGTALQGPKLPGEVPSAFLNNQSNAAYFAPVHGAGSLTVSAGNLIEVGNLSLQGIGRADFTTAGDIRGSGTLDIAGDLTLRAGQVYATSATSFTLAASNYTAGGVTSPGTITIVGNGARALPYSAGGTLGLYASVITQGGTVRAPFGVINLGWNGSGVAPIDAITGQAVPVATQVTLAAGSVTSVSGLDPATGKAITLPYGLNFNGTAWIDPRGNDITSSGLPSKQVNIAGQSVTTEAGSTVDIDGGGDLYAYRFSSGVGGTVDILAAAGSFAVIPGYQADYAPFAPYNTNGGVSAQTYFGTDQGYANAALAAGDRVYLDGSAGLPAGVYTLLPARYVLLPGAFLVTPKSGAPTQAAVVQPDGASTVAGYRFNDTTAVSAGAAPLRSSFEVASQAVVRTRAQYDDSFANAYFDANAPAARTPLDAGQLVFSANQAMRLLGGIDALAAAGGRGGLIDISAPVDIVIGAPGAVAAPGQLLLDASELGAYRGASILIGGTRSTGADGTSVAVATNNLTVDNAGSPLSGADLVLVAKQALTLAAGADIRQTGSLGGSADTLLFGSATTAGSGDGALLRVSGDPSASIVRAGVSAASTASLALGAGANVAGGSALILDSTGATTLGSGAVIGGQAVTLDSGRISLQLADPGALQPGAGLVLTGAAIQSLQASSSALSLLSYSSIDIYGAGQIGSTSFESLALHSPSLRGFNTNGGAATFVARTILLDGDAGGTAPTASGAAAGSLAFNATDTLALGSGQLAVGQYATLALSAGKDVSVAGTGRLAASGNVTLSTPVLTGETAANQQIVAGGVLTLSSPANAGPATVAGGLGANLALTGASLAVDGKISLPSGTLALRATTGDLAVGNAAPGLIDVGGTAKTTNGQTLFTDGGTVSLTADAGSVTVAAGSTISVAAQAGGGDAGLLSVSVPTGTFALGGTLSGQAGTGGQGGTFSLDAVRLTGGALAPLDAALDAGGFSRARDFRFRTGDVIVDGLATAKNFTLSADGGSVTVTGKIDASGATGGRIQLSARDSLTLASGTRLTVAAQDFDNAGKGGAVVLEAGSETGGVINSAAVLDLQTGAAIDLSVAKLTAASAALGDFSGTLHLRAPQTVASDDLQIGAVNATILGASSIVAEGYKLFDLTASGGVISTTDQANVLANGTTFGGNDVAIKNRLLANNDGLRDVFHVQPGAELINRTGDLTLNANWDLSGYRSGSGVDPAVLGSGEAGNLTLRAAGNLVFGYNTTTKKFASLSDGFALGSRYGLWDGVLLAPGVRSWSYTLVAGGDLGAAGRTQVKALAQLGADSGSFLLGLNSPALPTTAVSTRQIALAGSSTTTAFYQVIRTGTGDIDIAAGRDVRILNPLAAIYTAGTQAAAMANFDTPNTLYRVTNALGTAQTLSTNSSYGAYYALGGGNVTIAAQNDIGHFLQVGATLTADSSAELPVNWLYRRGQVDPVTGQFVAPTGPSGTPTQVASTTWWVDYNNFFEGVGALGGGNVTLTAGRDVANVDAVAPTNGRMPKGTPDAAALVELGGGDVTVQAGRNIDGGVYYVERGLGTLAAGGAITTNATRAAVQRTADRSDPDTWLPTTLFLGKGSFDVSAAGDLLLGSVANPFLLPQGINNSYYNKTYFTTYALDDAVDVSSLTGAVTLKSDPNNNVGSLANWISNVLSSNIISGTLNTTYGAYNQPWLRLAENDPSQFGTGAALMPATLRVAAFSGDVNLVGGLTLAPSPTGTLSLYAQGSINGLRPNGLITVDSPASATNPHAWSTATITVSDADPASLPGVATPLSLAIVSSITPVGVLSSLDALFAESGSTEGDQAVLQTQQRLHDPGLLHRDDAEPLRLYADTGDISGLTLYSPKATQVIAGQDITDIALYLQNLAPGDTSVVSAGRDLIAYDAKSALRAQAVTAGNALVAGENTARPGTGDPTAGDIQIGGPGALVVTAGRNLDLGESIVTPDGTAKGITSIGNARNPALPAAGAAITVAAGFGGGQRPDYQAFNALFLDPASAYAARYLPALGRLLGLTGASGDQIWAAFNELAPDERDSLSTTIFYTVLRDAGRDHNDPASAGFGKYTAGFAAVDALFPGSKDWAGDLSLSSREISTANGGAINVLAPGGHVSLGVDLPKNAGAPPGIITERGGGISIFARDNIEIGAQRIFTLRGGDVLAWSSTGNIAAGFSSKTVQSASPTRVLIDPQSGDVKSDPAGLATGGGIGVLAAVAGVAPGNVDLIAPFGTIDAGDAGIRSTGNLNIAALQILNAGNIQTGGTSTGVPAAAAPSVSAPPSTPASESSRAAADLAQTSRDQNRDAAGQNDMPSLISVEVLGYGGGDASAPDSSDQDGGGKDGKDEKKKPRKKDPAPPAAEQLTQKVDPAGTVPPAA